MVGWEVSCIDEKHEQKSTQQDLKWEERGRGYKDINQLQLDHQNENIRS